MLIILSILWPEVSFLLSALSLLLSETFIEQTTMC